MTHFLASDKNPDGYKLEAVLQILINEMITRMGKITGDDRNEARHVLQNDIKILGLLSEATKLAEDSTSILNKSFGPSTKGKPRIGTT